MPGREDSRLRGRHAARVARPRVARPRGSPGRRVATPRGRQAPGWPRPEVARPQGGHAPRSPGRRVATPRGPGGGAPEDPGALLAGSVGATAGVPRAEITNNSREHSLRQAVPTLTTWRTNTYREQSVLAGGAPPGPGAPTTPANTASGPAVRHPDPAHQQRPRTQRQDQRPGHRRMPAAPARPRPPPPAPARSRPLPPAPAFTLACRPDTIPHGIPRDRPTHGPEPRRRLSVQARLGRAGARAASSLPGR
jgi:hypothetical protein